MDKYLKRSWGNYLDKPMGDSLWNCWCKAMVEMWDKGWLV